MSSTGRNYELAGGQPGRDAAVAAAHVKHVPCRVRLPVARTGSGPTQFRSQAPMKKVQGPFLSTQQTFFRNSAKWAGTAVSIMNPMLDKVAYALWSVVLGVFVSGPLERHVWFVLVDITECGLCTKVFGFQVFPVPIAQSERLVKMI